MDIMPDFSPAMVDQIFTMTRTQDKARTWMFVVTMTKLVLTKMNNLNEGFLADHKENSGHDRLPKCVILCVKSNIRIG